MPSRPWITPALCALLALSCASGGARVDGRSVQTDRVDYEIGPVPPSWRRVNIADNDLAWVDGDTGSVIHVDHTCERSQDTPLTALVQHLLIGFTRREVSLEETVPFDQREARHVVLTARLDGVPRGIELYVMKKDGCVYDLGLVAPPARFDAARASFEPFARGFRTTRTSLSAP